MKLDISVNDFMVKQITEPKNITPELAWILGVMCGDGCLEKYRNYYKVSMSTTNFNFGKKFIDTINKIFNLNEKFDTRLFVNNNNSKYYKIQIYSKQLYNFFRKFSSFRCAEWRVPAQILTGNNLIKQSFLRGFFDSDGSINTYREKYKKIRAASINKKGLKEVLKLLNGLGITVNLIEEKNCYSLNIYRRNQINLFIDTIGFSFKG